MSEATTSSATAPPVLSVEERQAILLRHVNVLAKQGWTVLSQTASQASLTKGKNTSHGLHIFLSLITVGLWVPVWIVVAVVGGRRTRLVSVNEYGLVSTT